MGVSYEQSRGKTTKFKRQEMGDEPIKLFINSQGGHVEAGDTIHDMIKFIKPRVIIIGTGWVASAGITIYLAADKEDRYSLPNTRYMIHQPLGGCQGQATDINIEAKEIVRVRKRINNIISNALKYSADDFNIRMNEDGTIIFSNNAPNMNTVAAGQLFDRFYTVETDRNSTGLGLSIAKLLTEQMGGSIKSEYRDSKLFIIISFPE